MKTIASLSACVLALCCAPVAAQTYHSFDLGASGETFYNEIVLANGGVNAKATAWSMSRNASNPSFQRSELVQWSPGIGVKNSSEYITDIPYVPFYVDNQDHYDFVLFVFDQAVDITSVQVNPSGNAFDLDASFWLGNVSASLDLAGYSFADLSSAGFGPRINNDWYATSTPRSIGVTSPGGGVNALLFGARVNGDSSFDRFKVSTLGFYTIPEPSSAGLMAFGIALIVIRRRR